MLKRGRENAFEWGRHYDTDSHTYNVDTQHMHTHTQGIHVLMIVKLAVSRARLAAFPHLCARPGSAVYQLARGGGWRRRASADEGSANTSLKPRAGACFTKARHEHNARDLAKECRKLLAAYKAVGSLQCAAQEDVAEREVAQTKEMRDVLKALEG